VELKERTPNNGMRSRKDCSHERRRQETGESENQYNAVARELSFLGEVVYSSESEMQEASFGQGLFGGDQYVYRSGKGGLEVSNGNGYDRGKGYKTRSDLQSDCEEMAGMCHEAWLILGQVHDLADGMQEALGKSLLLPVLKSHMDLYKRIAEMTNKWKGYHHPRDLQGSSSTAIG